MAPYLLFGFVMVCCAIGGYLGPERGQGGISIKQSISDTQHAFKHPLSKKELEQRRQKNLVLLVIFLLALLLLVVVVQA